jgi:cytochrome P450
MKMERMKSSLMIDYNSTLFQTNPWPLYQDLRNHDPIHWSENYKSFYLSKYKHVKQVLLDTENFTVEHPFRTSRHLFGSTILDTDGKAHKSIRPIISNQFKPSAIQTNLDPIVKRVVKKVVDEIPAKQPIDFMNEVAIRIPMVIIMEVLGLPSSDAIEVFNKMRPMIRLMDDPKDHFSDAISASDEFYSYIENAVQKASPRGIIAHFMTSVENGQWSMDKLIRHVLILLIGGSETTSCSIGNIMTILIERKEEMKLARTNREYLKNVIQETLRWQPPLHTTTRISKRDVQLEDTIIPKGKFVTLSFASANRDEEVYEHPELWNPTRKEKNSLSFGMGTHFCLGQSLAMIEMEETFGALFSRFHEVELVQTEPPVIQGKSFRSPGQLFLSFS